MSRTWHKLKALKQGCGKEYWKSRLHKYGEVLGKYTKILTHRKERRASKIEENELLKSYIACEVDNMAAYAPFDELGNKMRYVQRAYFTVGHIIPELEELKREVEVTCTPEPQETKDEV